jgi:hypothetical protein
LKLEQLCVPGGTNEAIDAQGSVNHGSIGYVQMSLALLRIIIGFGYLKNK